jgi:hypothetical protein
MANRTRPAWVDMFGRKPIKRPVQLSLISRNRFGQMAEKLALEDQFERMIELKREFGIEKGTGWRTWYALALALAAERNPAFSIVDPTPKKKGKTAARWVSTQGLQLLDLVDCVVANLQDRGEKTTWKHILKALSDHPDYKGMNEATLKANYSRAKKHWPDVYRDRPKRKK